MPQLIPLDIKKGDAIQAVLDHVGDADAYLIATVCEVIRRDLDVWSPPERFVHSILIAYNALGGMLKPADVIRVLEEFSESIENNRETVKALIERHPELLKSVAEGANHAG